MLGEKSSYNPNIHKRKSIRLKGYDYSKAGLYFITICCKNRIPHFGNISNGKMILNQYGIIAHNEWANTPFIRPNIELGEFIIMPDHMHAIIRICTGVLHTPVHIPHTRNDIPHTDDRTGVLHTPYDIPESHNHRGVCNTPLRSPSQTIGALIRGYKSSVTKQLNSFNIDCPIWQRNYYEHIIRDEKSYQNISNYIINNPRKWAIDTCYKTENHYEKK